MGLVQGRGNISFGHTVVGQMGGDQVAIHDHNKDCGTMKITLYQVSCNIMGGGDKEI